MWVVEPTGIREQEKECTHENQHSLLASACGLAGGFQVPFHITYQVPRTQSCKARGQGRTKQIRGSSDRSPQMLMVSTFNLRKMLPIIKVFPPIPYAWVEDLLLFLPFGNHLWMPFISGPTELRIVIPDLQRYVPPSLVTFTSAPGLGIKQVWLSVELETQQEDSLS